MQIKNKDQLKEKARQLLAQGLQHCAQGVNAKSVASALANAAFADHVSGNEQGYVYSQIKQQAIELAGSDKVAGRVIEVGGYAVETQNYNFGLISLKAKNLRQGVNMVLSVNTGTVAVDGCSVNTVNLEGSANSVVLTQDSRPEAAAAAASAQGSSNATAPARNRSNPTVKQAGPPESEGSNATVASPPDGLNATGGAAQSDDRIHCVDPGHFERQAGRYGDIRKRASSHSHSPSSTKRSRLLVVPSRSDIEEFNNLILPECVGFIRSRIHEFPKYVSGIRCQSLGSSVLICVTRRRVVQAVCAAEPAVAFPPHFEKGGWDISRCANLMSRLPREYRLPTEADSGMVSLKRKRNGIVHADEDGFPAISDNELMGLFDVGTTLLHTLGVEGRRKPQEVMVVVFMEYMSSLGTTSRQSCGKLSRAHHPTRG
ncbi:MAG: hypothetical protein BJ554DRAFT_1757, partial [Olpidium bornovanus]